MIPLRIVARLGGPSTGAPILDGLLAFVVAQRAGLVAGFGPLQPIDIPIATDQTERIYMCSSPSVRWEARELRYLNRKFPIGEAQMLAEPKLKRVNISMGACRSYRLPGDVAWAEGDSIAWWCIGDAEKISMLLRDVTHLGKRRAVGRGRVDRWEVEMCEPWDEGFPVVRDGMPLRPLPLDWPGLAQDVTTGYSTLRPPYWLHANESLCAMPSNA